MTENEALDTLLKKFSHPEAQRAIKEAWFARKDEAAQEKLSKPANQGEKIDISSSERNVSWTQSINGKSFRFTMTCGWGAEPGMARTHRNTVAQARVSDRTGDHAGHILPNERGFGGGQSHLFRQHPSINLGSIKTAYDNRVNDMHRKGSAVFECGVTVTRSDRSDRPFMNRQIAIELTKDNDFRTHEMRFINSTSQMSRAADSARRQVANSKTIQTAAAKKGPRGYSTETRAKVRAALANGNVRRDLQSLGDLNAPISNKPVQVQFARPQYNLANERRIRAESNAERNGPTSRDSVVKLVENDPVISKKMKDSKLPAGVIDLKSARTQRRANSPVNQNAMNRDVSVKSGRSEVKASTVSGTPPHSSHQEPGIRKSTSVDPSGNSAQTSSANAVKAPNSKSSGAFSTVRLRDMIGEIKRSVGSSPKVQSFTVRPSAQAAMAKFRAATSQSSATSSALTPTRGRE